MPAPEFDRLRACLIEGGIAPRYVQRTIQELKEHFSDIEIDALDSGASASEAAAWAREAIGSEEGIASAVLAHTDLLPWSVRWPRSAYCLRTTVYCALLPIAPAVYCAQHSSMIVRWGVSTTLAFLLTSGFLLSLEWIIAFG